MIPVTQTRLGWPGGNCLAACFASILEVPIEAVDFSCSDANEPGQWYHLANEKLRPHGYFFFDMRAGRNDAGELGICVPNGQFLIVGGRTCRGPIQHAMVYAVDNNRYIPVHDPHPSRAGLTEILYFGILVPLGR